MTLPTIRAAQTEDVPGIHDLVCELAEFEKLSHQVVSTPDDFQAALFGDPPAMEALVADALPEAPNQQIPNQLAGTALFYSTFSTFTGKRGLWLEDVYVRPEFRGQGLGKAFLDRFLSIARERNCARAEWSVLDWNENAIGLYEKLGATVLPDWRICRVDL